jgi:hypothetical protein
MNELKKKDQAESKFLTNKELAKQYRHEQYLCAK